MTRSYTIPRNFWRVVRRILRHGTYTCCQLSYDVGQRVSIVARNRAWIDGSIFILYAKWKTHYLSDEPGRPPTRRRVTRHRRSMIAGLQVFDIEGACNS